MHKVDCTYHRSRFPVPLPVLILEVVLNVLVVARARGALEELLQIVLDVLQSVQLHNCTISIIFLI